MPPTVRVGNSPSDGISDHRKTTPEPTFHPDRPPVSVTTTGLDFVPSRKHSQEHFSTDSGARKRNPIRDEDFFTIRWQEAGVAHRLIG